MENRNTSFNDYVISSILANNEFGIKEVDSLEPIKSMLLDRELYPRIIELIKQKKLNEVKLLMLDIKGDEYLDVMQFVDQQNRNYVVTVYSNNALEHDPQVIDIIIVD